MKMQWRSLDLGATSAVVSPASVSSAAGRLKVSGRCRCLKSVKLRFVVLIEQLISLLYV